MIDKGGPDAGARAGRTGDRIGRGDKRISSVVHIQESPLRAFKKQLFALTHGAEEVFACVNNKRPYPVLKHPIALDNFIKLQFQTDDGTVQQSVFLGRNLFSFAQ